MGRLARKIANYAQAWQSELANLVAIVLDLRRRFDFIQVAQANAMENRRFQEANEHYFSQVKKSFTLRAFFAPGQEFLVSWLLPPCSYSIVPSLGIQVVFPQGSFKHLSLLDSCLSPLKSIGEQITKWSETSGALSRSLELLRQPSSTALRDRGPKSLKRVEEFRIEKLSLSRGDHFSLEVNELDFRMGRAYALVGASGSGKSSFVRSLVGLYQADSLEISVPKHQLLNPLPTLASSHFSSQELFVKIYFIK